MTLLTDPVERTKAMGVFGFAVAGALLSALVLREDSAVPVHAGEEPVGSAVYRAD
jgi:hypothetical protein